MPNASQRTSATPREADEALPAATERASVRETLRKSAITLYAGIALLLGWFYGIWFVPAAFCNVSMMGWDVTIAWLVMLFTSAATMLAASSSGFPPS